MQILLDVIQFTELRVLPPAFSGRNSQAFRKYLEEWTLIHPELLKLIPEVELRLSTEFSVQGRGAITVDSSRRPSLKSQVRSLGPARTVGGK